MVDPKKRLTDISDEKPISARWQADRSALKQNSHYFDQLNLDIGLT